MMKSVVGYSKNGNGAVEVFSPLQRRALADLLAGAFVEKISEAQSKSDALKEAIEEQIERELGAKVIVAKIRTLEDQMKQLKKQLDEVGFSENGNVWDGRAKKLLDERMHNSDYAIELRRIKDEALAKIWTCKTIDEAKKIFDGALKVNPAEIVKSIVLVK